MHSVVTPPIYTHPDPAPFHHHHGSPARLPNSLKYNINHKKIYIYISYIFYYYSFDHFYKYLEPVAMMIRNRCAIQPGGKSFCANPKQKTQQQKEQKNVRKVID